MRGLISDLFDDWTMAVFTVVLLAMLAGFAVIVVYSVRADDRFSKWAAAHHCRVVSSHDTTVVIATYCGKGCFMMVPYTTTERTYLCDGGQVVTR